MKSNRDLLQGLTILNTVLLFTFTEYSYSVSQSSSARTYENDGCGLSVCIGDTLRDSIRATFVSSGKQL
uniref:Uncharacterized protein n=1 Tax=Hyaloperonospora arabidopsidis (strain Emoy2) TaxID=559515 RepID=M4B3H4_HYAAE